jgi:hypothetical protein
MPPRFSYWTIVAGGLPTAFRATKREELLPTFARIRETHSDAVLKWFARGRLWDTPEQAKEALTADAPRQRQVARSRGRDWRPGGEHRDPRQKFIDAQKALNAERRRERWERKQGTDGEQRGDGTRAKDGRVPPTAGSHRPLPRPPRKSGRPAFGRSSGPGSVDRRGSSQPSSDRPRSTSRSPGATRPSGRPFGKRPSTSGSDRGRTQPRGVPPKKRKP